MSTLIALAAIAAYLVLCACAIAFIHGAKNGEEDDES